MPDLAGAGIGFVGDDACTVLRAPTHSSGLPTYVVLQDEVVPDPEIVPPPDIRLELTGVGLNCSGAVMAWGALAGEGLAAPLSGGATLALALVTWGAAIATSAQCATSIIRATDIWVNDGQWTRWLDSNEYYETTSVWLDRISLLGAVASGSAAVRAAMAIRRATGRSRTVILKGLSRAERKRLSEELIRLEKPALSNGAMKDLIRAGQFPKRLTSREVSKRLFIQLQDAVSASLAFTGSAVSGQLHTLYVHVVQD